MDLAYRLTPLCVPDDVMISKILARFNGEISFDMKICMQSGGLFFREVNNLPGVQFHGDNLVYFYYLFRGLLFICFI